MTDAELLAEIERLARNEGFEVAGAIPLNLMDDQRLDRWLEQGFAGEMAYMAKYRDQRCEPAKHFAPFRSVVSFILPYDTTEPSPSPEIGNIARYALGDDYHEVIKKRLFRVLDALKLADPTIEARACVDTAPILEKVAAQRSGVGWQGKHSNIIREGRGSWFFLAEILINRNLETRESSTDRCGICDDCIQACPTGAITSPYVVDSRLCISYLTIELRGLIPRQLRSMIGNRIFGCDDCQEVCPWNRLAALPSLEEFTPRKGLRSRTLSQWMDQDLESWRLTFRRSAVKRTKFHGFKRNVAVAMGNHKSSSNLPSIRRALGVEPALVRAHLIWALRKMDCQESSELLSHWRSKECETMVLAEFHGDPDSPLESR